MVRSLIQLCVRHYAVVTLIAALALIVTGWLTWQAPLDVFPEFVPSQVEIQTEAPGLSPSQVEQLVTKHVEDSVAGASGVDTLRSQSIPGLSVITLTFLDNIDLRSAREGVSERLSELNGTLPLGVGTPKLSALVSSTMDLLKIGLLSDRVDAATLRDTADWVIKPRLLSVPGVAHVIVFGGEVRQIQIQPDPVRLQNYALSLTDLSDAVQKALSLHGAGVIDLPAQRVLLRSPIPSPDLDVLGMAVVGLRAGIPVRLRDVAQIDFGPALKTGDALIMGQRGVLLSLASQYGANTLATTRAVEATLTQLIPALRAQGITVYPALHRPATFIERALSSLQRALLIAGVLILMLLYAFLRNVRAALIAFLAIPLSLCVATAVLSHYGQTLNTLTLGGFAVALGVLVDDAIIDIENILRRLRENRLLARPLPTSAVILAASLEVRRPVLYATAVVIAAFLPALFSTSLQGHFVGPMALAFVLAVLASLLVAMTVTPALCALLLRGHAEHPPPRWVKWLQRRQSAAIGWSGRRLIALGAALTLASVAAVVVLVGLPDNFMPDFREGHFVMQVTSAAPGTSLEQMVSLGQRISRDILALPYIQSVEQQIGRAAQGEDTWGPHQSEFHIELKPDSPVDQQQAQAALRELIGRYPGINSDVVTFLGDRIGESLSGETAQAVIKIFGEDLDQLDRIGTQIQTLLARQPGISDLSFNQESTTPVVDIHLQPAALAATGLSAQQVLTAVQLAYGAEVIGQTYSGTRTLDVVLQLPAALRSLPTSLKDLMVSGPLGSVPLSQVARLELTHDRYRIEHDGGQRRVVVSFNAQGVPLESVVAAAKQAIAAHIALPPGVLITFSGAAEAARQARLQLMLYSALALGLIVIGLTLAFRWRAHTGLVLINLPFCLIGSVTAIALSGLGLSLGAWVGLVTVFGISARNSILQLAHYEHLVDSEGAPWNDATLMRGAHERLTPILMTALMTALGLAPLAFGAHQPGEEIEAPMAVAVLGGLVSSTLLNLTLLPALARRFARPSDPTPSPAAAELPLYI